MPGGQEGEGEGEGERQWRRRWGRRCARHAPNPPLQPGPGALPHEVQLRTWTASSWATYPALNSWPEPQAPRGRAREGTRGCNRSFCFQLPARPRLAVRAPEGSSGVGHPGQESPGQPSSQPAVQASGSQQSQSGRLGWGGGRSGQDPNEELPCSPSSPAAFPLPKPGPASRREGVTRHPKQP